MKVHTDERPYKCNKCAKAFKRKMFLILHSKVHRQKNYGEIIAKRFLSLKKVFRYT